MSKTARGISCEGWWDEQGLGRQPMLDLQLAFVGGQISGSGRDIVGPFLFMGKITAQGQVVMVKQYVGQHEVEYRGTYDGEGLMWGEWHIGPLKDRWMIRLRRARDPAIKQSGIVELAWRKALFDCSSSNATKSVRETFLRGIFSVLAKQGH